MSRAIDPRQTRLFDADSDNLELAPGARMLGRFAEAEASALLAAIRVVETASPFRHMVTARGHAMSAAMTNCGAAGWVSDRRGYRYTAEDPLIGRPWPPMPPVFLDLAARAAAAAGYADFRPDAGLINRYAPGARMALHQDRDEADLTASIVSVSLGLPAIFLWGGAKRSDRARRIPLIHGDVVVWGGPSRLAFHGIDTLKEGDHPLTGARRYNLTFRRAL